jgi:hypothetical protein
VVFLFYRRAGNAGVGIPSRLSEKPKVSGASATRPPSLECSEPYNDSRCSPEQEESRAAGFTNADRPEMLLKKLDDYRWNRRLWSVSSRCSITQDSIGCPRRQE